jgi:Asp-tRNA(Asn)/Glu-tRNA(Gln) amidotransferase A subunit family amidase
LRHGSSTTPGSDSGGSARMPAAFCGVVGVHPTPGRVPAYAFKPEAHPFAWGSSVGPLCRDVRDAALVLRAIAGPDPRDLLSLPGPPPDPLADLEAGAAGLRLAWTDDFGFAAGHGDEHTPEVVATARAAAARFAELGAEVDAPGLVLDDPAGIREAIVAPLSEPQAPTPGHPAVTGPLRPLHEPFVAALEARAGLARRVQEVLERHDLLLSVTVRSIAPTLETVRVAPRAWAVSHTMLFNVLGLPAVSIPCGFVAGLPVGLQLAGPRDSEPLLLRAAHAFLAAFPATARPPLVARTVTA